MYGWCLHCGETPEFCMCVPWCYEHDRLRPCEPCALSRDEQALTRAQDPPWWERVLRWVSGIRR